MRNSFRQRTWVGHHLVTSALTGKSRYGHLGFLCDFLIRLDVIVITAVLIFVLSVFFSSVEDS